MILYLDTETFSETPIKHGTYIYAANAEIMLVSWAVNDDPVQVWDLTAGESIPSRLADAFAEPDCTLVASNAMFDRTVLRLARNSTPVMRAAGAQIDRWHDVMVQALSCSLPGALAKMGVIMGLPEDQQKAKEGRAFINRFCKPTPKSSKVRRNTRHTHPEEWTKFKEYAAQDTLTMRVLHRKLPVWNYQGDELALWHLDQQVNDRGVCVDVEFAKAAIETAERAKAELAQRTVELTNGEVQAATQRDKLLLHILESYGVYLPDLQASTLERRVNDPDLPWALRQLLDVRMQSSMGSSAKYKALLNAVSSDGRLRGTLQFNGANRTGRWAGRTFQPQNLFRPLEYVADRWEFAIDAIKGGVCDVMFNGFPYVNTKAEPKLGNVMEVTASAVRGALIAPPGKKLVVADLSNIEGRMLAWLAGEEWKLQAFRDYDAGIGHDLYKLAFARAFRMDAADVGKEQRQVGKVMELALGFGGGVGAFITFSLVYNIDLDDMAEKAWSTIPADVLDEAAGFLKWTIKQRRSTFGLSDRTFIVCDALKRLWRRAHPRTESLWAELENAQRRAIGEPGNTFICRRFKVRRDGAWLRVGLPSGRVLCYPQPEVGDKGEITYAGVNQYTRKWQRIKTYGGKLCENAVQAGARDVFANSLPSMGPLGYDMVLGVHDEAITETDDSPDFTGKGLAAIMTRDISWAPGLPLAAEGAEMYRYRK